MNKLILAYIDPGTGSMLFAILLGIITTLFFALRGVIISIKTKLAGGKTINRDEKIPLVIFSDGKQYWKVFEPICDELEKRNFRCEYWTASADDPALKKNYGYVKTSYIGSGNKPYATLNVMNAKICLSTTPGLDVYQWKRSKDVDYYVHIYHSVGDGLDYRMFGLDYYDAVLVSSKPEYGNIRKVESARNLPTKEIADGGITYMDKLKERHELEKNEISKNDNESCTVLLAPSWGETSILNRYGEKIIKALLNTGYHIIIRPHPQSKISDAQLLNALQTQFSDNKQIEWNYDIDNYDALNRSNIMISDFSGVMFDYAFVFDRPIIYADVSFDPAPYDAAWVEHRDLMDCLPQLGKQLKQDKFPNLKSIIDELILSEDYIQSRKEVREKMWLCEGIAAKTIVDYVINKEAELCRRE